MSSEKEEKKMSINAISSLIIIIVSFHYYLSYLWISGILKIYKLDHLSIITIQDIMFPFVRVNYIIITMFSFSFIAMFLIEFFNISLAENKLLNLLKITEKLYRHIESNIGDRPNIFKTLKIIAIFLFLIFLIWTIYLLNQIENMSLWIIIFLVLLPIGYMIYVKKRSYILAASLFLIFLGSGKLVETLLEDTIHIKPKTITHLSFKYHNDTISTNDSLSFLLHSYNFLILKDTVNKSYKIYENKDISHLNFREEEITKKKNIKDFSMK